MHLYSVTLQEASAITASVVGNFTGAKTQEIVVAKGKVLEILRPAEHGRLVSLHSTEVFGLIRSVVPFRLTGGNKDYLAVGSDSGRIVILEFNTQKNSFEKIHQETFGKTGCRRIVPGQYVACDPKGRALMIAAVEKQKLVYTITRDSAARLTISSPLEAHKAHGICHAVCGVDVSFNNPIFACLEVDYTEADQDPSGEALEETEKQLVFYELDLGLNHVVRKWADGVDMSANMLVTVPGGSDGPGGVLVCSENWVVWKNHGHQERRVPIPRRRDLPADRGILLVSSATHKQKDLFFFLLQSEYGDIYKVTLTYAEENVTEVVIKYFDTLPPCISINVLKSGFLFAASEFGNHAFYQFQGIGEEDQDGLVSSKVTETDNDELDFVFFNPHPMRNLVQVDDLESLSPIVDCKIANYAQDTTGAKQLYTLCGRGPRSSLRVLKHGLAVTEIAVSDLPGNPTAVWTLKKHASDENDSFIVVSFVNATLVLSIGEEVEEVTDSGFHDKTPTLCCALIGDDSFIQVHPQGIRHIKPNSPTNEWKTPGMKTITKCAVNGRQVVISLSGGDLLYFELNSQGNLEELQRKEAANEVICMDIAPLSEGRIHSRFMAVSGWDGTVRILSLDSSDCLDIITTQALPRDAQAESVALVSMAAPGDSGGENLYLFVGLNNGVLMRTQVDPTSGELSDERSRFMGARPVRLFKNTIRGSPGVTALSSRPWMAYMHQSRYHLEPLSYEQLEFCSDLSSEHCPEGIVAIAGSTLRILTLERLGEAFNQTIVPLRYTPRRMVEHPVYKHLVVIESDHNTFNQKEKEELKKAMADGDGDVAMNGEDGEDLMPEAVFGVPRAGNGKWASCVRVVNPTTHETINLLELDNNEAAFSICTCKFHEKGDQVFLVVGTAKDMTIPRNVTCGYIHVYQHDADGSLTLVHKTEVEDVPTALCAFKGRLLVGMGKLLRIYDLGKKKLLRKCENKQFPAMINFIEASPQGRIYVGDMAESIHFVKYKTAENQLYIFADDAQPRWLTATAVVDWDTMAGADRFGNVFVGRLPSEISEEIEEDPTGSKLKWDSGYLNGAPNKVETLASYFVGEGICSLQKASLVPGGMDVLMYTTLLGGIGAFIPFTSREDVEFFSTLEMHLRQENPPLCGRDHVMFRSFYNPVKECVDGDFCEQYMRLDLGKQKMIAEELDRTPQEVMKKIEEMRNRVL